MGIIQSFLRSYQKTSNPNELRYIPPPAEMTLEVKEELPIATMLDHLTILKGGYHSNLKGLQAYLEQHPNELGCRIFDRLTTKNYENLSMEELSFLLYIFCIKDKTQEVIKLIKKALPQEVSSSNPSAAKNTKKKIQFQENPIIKSVLSFESLQATFQDLDLSSQTSHLNEILSTLQCASPSKRRRNLRSVAHAINIPEPFERVALHLFKNGYYDLHRDITQILNMPLLQVFSRNQKKLDLYLSLGHFDVLENSANKKLISFPEPFLEKVRFFEACASGDIDLAKKSLPTENTETMRSIIQCLKTKNLENLPNTALHDLLFFYLIQNDVDQISFLLEQRFSEFDLDKLQKTIAQLVFTQRYDLVALMLNFSSNSEMKDLAITLSSRRFEETLSSYQDKSDFYKKVLCNLFAGRRDFVSAATIAQTIGTEKDRVNLSILLMNCKHLNEAYLLALSVENLDYQNHLYNSFTQCGDITLAKEFAKEKNLFPQKNQRTCLIS